MATLLENANRIYTDKENIKKVIIDRGIAVPDGTSLDDFANLISQINNGVDASVVTATANDVLEGKVIVDADGNPLTGTIVNRGYKTDVIKIAYNTSEDNMLRVGFPTGYYESLTGDDNDVPPYVKIPAEQVNDAMDITSDKIIAGKSIGTVEGSATSDATATAGYIADGYTAYANGEKIEGSLPLHRDIVDYAHILAHDGTGKVYIGYPYGAYTFNNNSPFSAYGDGVVSVPYEDFMLNIGLTADKLMANNTILGVEGTATSDTDINTNEILFGKVAYAKGGKLIGSMANKGAWTGDTTDSGNVTIPKGYHNGNGYVSGSGAYNTGYHDGVSATKVGTAGAADVLTGKTFTSATGVKLSGSMPNNGSVNKILDINATYTIPKGYHDGTGKVTQVVKTLGGNSYTPKKSDIIIPANQYLLGDQIIKGDANLVAENIMSGKTIFGVAGTATSKKRMEFAFSEVYMNGTYMYLNGISPGDWSTTKWSNIIAGTNSEIKFEYFHNLGLTSGKEYFVCMNLYDLGEYGFRFTRGYAATSTTVQYWYTNVIPFTGHATVDGSESVSRLFSTKTIGNYSNYCYTMIELYPNSIVYTLGQQESSSAIAVRNTADGINCSLIIAG